MPKYLIRRVQFTSCLGAVTCVHEELNLNRIYEARLTFSGIGWDVAEIHDGFTWKLSI